MHRSVIVLHMQALIILYHSISLIAFILSVMVVRLSILEICQYTDGSIACMHVIYSGTSILRTLCLVLYKRLSSLWRFKMYWSSSFGTIKPELCDSIIFEMMQQARGFNIYTHEPSHVIHVHCICMHVYYIIPFLIKSWIIKSCGLIINTGTVSFPFPHYSTVSFPFL